MNKKKLIVLLCIISAVVILAISLLMFVLLKNKIADSSASDLKPSEGLEFTLNSDRESYTLSGIGTCTDSEIVIPNKYNGKTVTSIGMNAFYRNQTITKVVIPDSVKIIESAAFRECINLIDVVIGDGVTEIADMAFYQCVSLKSVKMGRSVESISGMTFNFCTSLESITLPDSLKRMGPVFDRCTSLKEINIPASLEEYPFWVMFSSCSSLEKINVDKNHPIYKSIDGNVYTKDGKELVFYASGKAAQSFEVPQGVTRIYPRAFMTCQALEKVVLPDSIEEIENLTFYDCYNLKSINIPSSVKFISGNLFYMGNLDSDVPLSLELNEYKSGYYLGDDDNPYRYLVKRDMGDIKNFRLHNDVEFVAAGLFEDYKSDEYTKYDNAYYVGSDDNPYMMLVKGVKKNITSCEIHPDTKIIYHNAFGANMKGEGFNLKSIVIPDSVTMIGDSAFQFSQISSITLGKSVTYIGNNAFSKSQLKKLILPDSIKIIGSNIVSSTKVTEVVVPLSVEYIASHAFSGCKNIYCEAAKKPTGWKNDWHESPAPLSGNGEANVVWNYKDK